MRLPVVISVAVALGGLTVLTGCPFGTASDEAGFGRDPGGGGDDNGAGAPQSACQTDLDCELASSSCCECPSFATHRGDPSNSACTGIVCPNPPACPANVRAACNLQTYQCEVACVEMTCATSCPEGYAIDPATGCLSCACAAPTTVSGCAIDSDCVQTREDCCGCARGGRDTAVLAGDLAAYDSMLFCPSNPQCPGIDTCDPQAEPRCVQGACVLTDEALPPNACAAQGSCMTGSCVINRDPAATTHGVGVCLP